MLEEPHRDQKLSESEGGEVGEENCGKLLPHGSSLGLTMSTECRPKQRALGNDSKSLRRCNFHQIWSRRLKKEWDGHIYGWVGTSRQPRLLRGNLLFLIVLTCSRSNYRFVT